MEVEVKGPYVAKGGEVGEERFGKVSEASIGERSSMNTSRPSSSSNSKDTSTISQGDQLESTKAEICEAEEENQRLKMLLSQIVKEYKSLQMHFFDVVLKQEQPKNLTDQLPSITSHDDQPDETELVSLRLGTNYSSKDQHKKMTSSEIKENNQRFEEDLINLGLHSKFGVSDNNNCKKEPSSNHPRPEDSFEEHKEEEGAEPWQPSKMLKNLRSREDEVSQQAHAKKARVSVRVRCDAPTMNDGCQWRKYGQKIAKGNPCPRAYYRCTVAPACPVRKQVQRCWEDMSILITTYEGSHNHPLPLSATSMASTTSAAASMLMSGSSTSRCPTSTAFSSSPTAGIHSLNFSLSDNSRTVPFYLPNTIISPSPSYSTITLDLTSPPPSTTQFNRSSSASSSFSISAPSSWSSRGAHEDSHGKTQSQYSLSSSYNLSYMQKPAAAPMNQNSLTDSIAKAITSDPSFQSALEAAITSYVGTSATKVGGINSNGAALGGNLVMLPPPLMALSSSMTNTSGTTVGKISWNNMK